MKISCLVALIVDGDLLDIWQRTVGEHLLPVQERAVRELGLLGPKSTGNIIVFSPTSSGKTFVGEMAAVQAARQDRKVFYLVPLKALAQEKYEELRDRYEGAGIRVVVSSRDHSEYDADIAKLDFGIAVVVYEKLQALLVGYPDLIEHTGLVVVDELQLITDPTRGASLELLLTKLITAAKRPRLIGLSAVLGHAERLASWLEAQLLVERHRPVELRKGVLHAGTFRYREHNTGRLCTEDFPDPGTLDRREATLSAVEHLVGLGEQVLVFEETRADSVGDAMIMADRLRLPIAQEGVDALAEREETLATLNLRRALESSVAFHNSDLSSEERALVERLFRSGRIRVLFSTPTLAMGVNLPVKNVIVPTYKYAYLKRYRKTSRVQLSKSDYENMSGRAGRYSLTPDFGRSLLVTESKWNAKVWMDCYVDADFEEVRPTLKDTALDVHLLDLVVSKLAVTQREAGELLGRSFTGQTEWLQALGQQELQERVAKAAEVCRNEGMLSLTGETLVPTPLGKVCAATGLQVHTAWAFGRWLQATAHLPIAPFDVLTALSFTPDGDDSYIPLSTREYHDRDYKSLLLRAAESLGLLDRPLIREIRESKFNVLYEEAKRVKKAMMLHAWIQERRTAEIEEAYQVWGGAIQRVAEEFGWLAEALAQAAEALHWSTGRQQELRRLSWRIQRGIKEDLLPLARLRVRGLGRVYLRRLADAGLADLTALKVATPDRLRDALNHRGLAERLHAHLHRDEKDETEERGAEASSVSQREAGSVSQREAGSVSQGKVSSVSQREAGSVSLREAGSVSQGKAGSVSQREVDTTDRPVPAMYPEQAPVVATASKAAEEAPVYGAAHQDPSHRLHLIGTCRQRRYLVKIDGRDVWLPNQPFRVLGQLAMWRRTKASEWFHQSDLDITSGAHRALSRLRKLLDPYTGPGPDGSGWIENNGHGGYRVVAQIEIEWDEQVMRLEHPDLMVLSASR
jgi:helicase